MSEFTESFHKLTSSIITQLIAFLQVKYDQAQSPDTTHPTTMLVALSSLVVYYVIHVLLLRSPRPGRFASIAERVLVCSGYAAVATLAAAVFPEGASPFLYAIFGLLSASEVLYMSGQKLVTEDERTRTRTRSKSRTMMWSKSRLRFIRVVFPSVSNMYALAVWLRENG